MEGAFKNLDFEIYIDLNILYFLISNIEIFPYFTFYVGNKEIVNIVKKPLLNKKF